MNDQLLNDQLDWHISLHYLPTKVSNTQAVNWRDKSVLALSLNAEQVAGSFPALFDAFIQSINAMASGYAEGDGSFGIVGPAGRWKICGNIYEHDSQIQYAELVGRCPQHLFTEIISQLNVDTDQCAIQNMQGGFFQSFEQFFEAQAKPN